MPPDLQTNLQKLKNEIFATMNCIQIGKINSFDTATQSATVEIQMKRRTSETEIVDYPVLVDCPVFFLQGGGAFVEMPIQSGDYCIILFNDRDIDNWFTTANIAEPASFRKHNLSDAIVLVGLNPSTSVLSLDNDKIQINSGTYPIKIKTTSGTLDIAVNGNITFNNGTESYLKGDYVVSTLQPLISALSSLVVTPSATPLTRGDISGVQSAATTLLALLTNWKSTQIKGA